jgi:hypothetical protein
MSTMVHQWYGISTCVANRSALAHLGRGAVDVVTSGLGAYVAGDTLLHQPFIRLMIWTWTWPVIVMH